MKFLKKTGFLAAAAMVFCLMPVTAKADDADFSYTLKSDGTAEIVCTNAGIVKAEIPSEIDGHKVTSLGENCFMDCSAMTEVIIPETVTALGDYAFFGCSSLETLEIPSSVTEIGDYAFDTTEHMTAFIVSENNPSYQSPDGVLYDKAGGTLMKYPEAKPDASYAVLDSCQNIDKWGFIGTQYLEELDLKQVHSIGEDAFYYCIALKSIAVPEGVTELPGAVFGYCESLEQITLPSTLTALGENCFYACTSLKSVRLPDNIKKLGAYAFCHCTSMESIIIPASLETVNAYCMGYYFDDNSQTYKVLENCTLYVHRDTAAWKYAVTNHLSYELIKSNDWIYYLLIGIVLVIIVILSIAIMKVLKQRRNET